MLGWKGTNCLAVRYRPNFAQSGGGSLAGTETVIFLTLAPETPTRGGTEANDKGPDGAGPIGESAPLFVPVEEGDAPVLLVIPGVGTATISPSSSTENDKESTASPSREVDRGSSRCHDLSSFVEGQPVLSVGPSKSSSFRSRFRPLFMAFTSKGGEGYGTKDGCLRVVGSTGRKWVKRMMYFGGSSPFLCVAGLACEGVALGHASCTESGEGGPI